MILVKFGGAWPWGDDETEECVGYFDAAHVVDANAPAGRATPDRVGFSMALSIFTDTIRRGCEGRFGVPHTEKYVEVKRR
jgi:hypothetical protein